MNVLETSQYVDLHFLCIVAAAVVLGGLDSPCEPVVVEGVVAGAVR